MIEFITQHQFWVAVAGYWILSAAVSSLPDPGNNSNPGYLWLYRFLHTIAGNVTTVLGSKFPGGFAGIKPAATSLLVTVLLLGCAAHYSIHPGALNTTDSAAYDALLIAETTIDQARLDYQAGQLPAESKEALDALIHSYNVARASWLAYRGALATNVASQEYFDQLNKNLSDLANAIRDFDSAWGNRPPVRGLRSGVPIEAVGGPDAQKGVQQ